MIEKFLEEGQAESIFKAAMLTGLMSEKQAADLLGEMEKNAQWGAVVDAGKSLLSGIGTVVSKIPGTVLTTGTLGAISGVVGASAYDAIKDRLTQEDPESKFNSDMEALYVARTRELEDAKWMAAVRDKRDKLKKGRKKMSPEEYSAEYNKLLDMLRERSVD